MGKLSRIYWVGINRKISHNNRHVYIYIYMSPRFSNDMTLSKIAMAKVFVFFFLLTLGHLPSIHKDVNVVWIYTCKPLS